jgi:hypothetical protein
MRRYLAFALVAITLLLAACSGSPDFGAAISSSAKAAEDEGTVRFETTIAGTEEDGTEITDKFSGVIDFQNKRAHLTFVSDEESGEMIFDEGDMYIKFESGFLGLGDGWFFVEGSDQKAPGSNPSDVFKALKRVDDARREGKERVRGVESTRYAITMKKSDVAASFGVSLTLEDQDDQDSTTVEGKVWIDGDGLIRRLSFTWLDDEDDGSSGTMTTDYWDWGTAPSVELPDPDDIMENPFGSMDDDDDSPFGGFVDEFEGASCYGTRVDECLGVNRAVDVLASDPSLCQTEEPRVCLVPVGNVRLDIVESIIEFHKRTKGIDVVILPSLAIPPAMVDRMESQITENGVYALVKNAYGVKDGTPSVFSRWRPSTCARRATSSAGSSANAIGEAAWANRTASSPTSAWSMWSRTTVDRSRTSSSRNARQNTSPGTSPSFISITRWKRTSTSLTITRCTVSATWMRCNQTGRMATCPARRWVR